MNHNQMNRTCAPHGHTSEWLEFKPTTITDDGHIPPDNKATPGLLSSFQEGRVALVFVAFKRTCPRPRPRAQYAFKDSMIHGVLQFALRIAFRCVLHRSGTQGPHATRDSATILQFSTTRLSLSLVRYLAASSNLQIRYRCPTTPEGKPSGLGSSPFAHHYLGNLF